MLPIAYDPSLVLASVLVAVMASYTGLRLTSGIGVLPPDARKVAIAKAAVALGGGIWSMHFVAMLAVALPVAIEYDALRTLGSVLIAILITGAGLMVLHFGPRTPQKLVGAGILTGLGIVSMHYVGMSAIGGNCLPMFEPAGYVISTLIAIGASIGALWLAYQRRTHAQIALGAVALGLAISAMHYSAMIYTRFALATEIVPIAEPTLSSGVLALIVAVAAFLICGLFLLTALPLGRETEAAAPRAAEPGFAFAGAGAPVAVGSGGASHFLAGGGGAAPGSAVDGRPATAEAGAASAPARLPYEHHNAVLFVVANDVSVIRADGHYTWIKHGASELFSPWSISKMETVLDPGRFIRTHRSYLVNVEHISGFSRDGDKAFCHVGADGDGRIPVSRTKVADVRRLLGMA